MNSRIRNALLVVFVSFFFSACSAPTLDATSDETVKVSIEKVRNSLSEDDRKEFGDLTGELIVRGAMASMFTDKIMAASALFRPYDGMTGQEFLVTARQEKIDFEENERKKEIERIAEKRAVDLEALSELQKRQKDAAIELEQLKKIEVKKIELETQKVSYSRNHKLYASITNGLDVPIAKLKFNYKIQSPDRSIPWRKGEGYFFISGGLEPGENRRLDATNGGMSMSGFILLNKAKEEHPEAVVSIEIYDVFGADNKSIRKVESLSERELAKLENLEEEYASSDGE